MPRATTRRASVRTAGAALLACVLVACSGSGDGTGNAGSASNGSGSAGATASTSGGFAGASSSAIGSCYVAGSGFCLAGFAAGDCAAYARAGQATAVTTCPTANLVGCCKAVIGSFLYTEACYYAPAFTSQTAPSAGCAPDGGLSGVTASWVATP
jgi:hypothetical protein